MKRKFIFLAMMLLTLMGGVKWNVLNAQKTVTIGNESQTNFSLPIEVYFPYSISQQSYSKTEIADAGGYAGNITSVAFKTEDEYSAGVRKLRVFMTNIDTENEVTFDYVGNGYYSLPNLDGLVFEGEVNFVGAAWNTIEFQTPFAYNGNHLLITVADDTGENQNDIYFAVHQKGAYDANNNSISWAANVGLQAPADPTSNISAGANGVRNQIQLTFSAAGEGGEEPTPEPEPEPTPTIPAAPASMTATANGQTITLTWEAVEGATSYNIYSTAAGNVPAVTATEYTYEGLTAGTQYCFEVTAENAAGESYDAASACATTEEAEIEEPVGPVVDLTKQYRVKANSLNKYLYVLDNDAHTDGTNGGVVIYQTVNDDAQLFTLEDAGDGAYYFKSATGYYIYCQAWNVDAYSTTAKTALKMVDQGDGTFRLQNTNNNKYFKVEQVGIFYYPFCDCDGVECTIETWTLEAVEGGEEPEPTPVAPAAPQNVVATANGQNSIVVTWNAVDGAAYYIVYKDGQMWDQVNGTTYTSTGLTAGTEYCYAVQAYDANDLESELSEEVCATTIPEGVIWNCSVEFVLGDTYGDGWNGNNLYVSYGDVTEKLTLSSGGSTTYVLDIPKGTHVTVTYKPEGSWQSENTFGVRYYGDTEYICTQYTITNNKTYTHEFDVNCEPSMPSVPALTATATGGSTIVLTIEGAGAESYNIYEGGELFAEGVTGNTYTAEGLEPETEYCFTATAVNFLGETEPSAAACATTLKAGIAIVQVGTGTTNTYQAPICDYYSSYSVSQMIYTEEEIGYGSGKVTSISFYQNEGTGPTRSLSVYMKNVSKDIFGNGTAEWEALEADLCVYQGSFTFGTSGWVEIALQDEFVYEAGNNLMVCVIDNTGSFPAGTTFERFAADVVTDIKTIFGTGNATDPLNITTNSYPLLNGTDNLRPIAKFVLEPAPADVKVKPETIAFGEAQLGEYWSENGAVTIPVTVKPIMTTITSITCDNEFFVLPAEIDYTANPIEFAVAYDHNAAAGEYTGNLTITYGDGATKVIPMTATAYAPATPDVFELAQEITFTENAYTDAPVFANLKDDYNLPKEANNGNTPDAVYSFELTKESSVAVEVTGTNAVYALYQEDFSGEEGPKADNKVKGNGALSSFAYDFNDGNLDDFYMIEKDAVTENYKNHEQNWKVIKDGPDASNCLISYSYNSNPSIHDANNYIVTKDKYVISADSKLTFDARNYAAGDPDYLKIEVSEDGENFTYLVTATPGMGAWATVEVELGTLLASTGLEYGEYHIALHHEEVYHMYIMVDNLALTSSNVSKISYPAGKYYLVAAAEEAFTVNVAIEALEGEEQIGKFIGKVIDEKTKTPIADATLKFSGEKSYETTTKEDGTFDIDAVVGNYTLEISHPNYETKQLTDLEITNSGTITDLMEIELVAIVKTATFVGGDSDNPTAWNVAANWNGGVLPTAEDNVIVAAEANINGVVAVNNLTINNARLTVKSGTLTVNGTITDSNEYGSLYFEDGAQIFQKNKGVKAYFRMSVNNPKEWSESNVNGWQFISSPMLGADISSAATKYDNAYNDSDYDLYKYNGAAEREWVNHKSGNFEKTFEQGRGYMYSHQARTIVTLDGTLNPERTFKYEVSYTEGEGNELANLHLLGNPFTFNMDWSEVTVENVYNGYATLNAAGDDYVYATEGTINVGDGFFVQVTGSDPTISYEKTRGSKETAANINVIARGIAGEDNVIINFAGEGNGFSKLQGFNKDKATVFVANNGKRYGIANVDENATEVALNFDAKEMGNYTISLDVNGEFETVTLVDRFTGIETNMLLEDEYNFTATTNDSHNRFVIRLANGQEPTANSQFVYQSGEELILSIEGSVQIVDMLGRVVYYNEHANGDNRINVAEFNDAAYVVRVVNEEGVKTQKVVIY